MKSTYTLHPWHGISPGNNCPEEVTAFIEIVPGDTVKYEIDKDTGWMKLDRPQLYSNYVPALYGFIPQTLCDTKVAEYCMRQTGRDGITGDQDPMDILVLTERTVNAGGILVQAKPIGGFRLIDKNEADDKIIAVLKSDVLYGQYESIEQLPSAVTDRLMHYFLTYKDLPGTTGRKVEITHTYSAVEARAIIEHSIQDYQQRFNINA
jgi:inorganic pyrophosphatase